jgi:glutathione S-transferase
VLWICTELGVPVEHVLMWDERKDPWFLAINPKGAVPAIRDGALLLHESNTIVSYIATKYGPAPSATSTTVTHQDGTLIECTTTNGGVGGGLLPVGAEATAIGAMWTEFAETTIAEKQNPIFFAKVRLGPVGCQPFPPGTTPAPRPGMPTDEELEARVQPLVDAWTAFDKALEKKFVCGDEFTTGDICAAVQANRFLKNEGFGYPQLAPAKFPNLVVRCAYNLKFTGLTQNLGQL